MNLQDRLQRNLGDWQSPENQMERCGICKGFHEEPVLMLMDVMRWSCYKAQAYEQLCLRLAADKAEESDFLIGRRYAEQIAPQWRRGIHPNIESDSEYLSRMVQLAEDRPDLELVMLQVHTTEKERQALGIKERRPGGRRSATSGRL